MCLTNPGQWDGPWWDWLLTLFAFDIINFLFCKYNDAPCLQNLRRDNLYPLCVDAVQDRRFLYLFERLFINWLKTTPRVPNGSNANERNL